MLYSVGEFLSSGVNLLLFMVVLPVVCGFLLWLFRKQYHIKLIVTLLSSVSQLIFALSFYSYGEFYTKLSYTPFGFNFSLRVYELPALFIVIESTVLIMIGLYTAAYLKNIDYSGLYLFYLYISIAMANGALLSDNLGTMLFFWEGLLCTLFGILLIKNKKNPHTAVKALTVMGFSDLSLMLGVILTSHVSETANMSEMNRLTLSGTCLFGFICIMIGILGQSGCMPFHSWLPNAADDAPTVFMTAFPGALQVLLGTYLAVRAVIDIYDFEPGNGMSIAVMAVGAVTVVCAAAMALTQKDIKRFIVYCSVGQVGYMVMGIGSGLAGGFTGAVLCMINTVTVITGLFMISGIIEKKTGTIDFRQLGGLQKKMPVIAACFIIFSLSLAGFPGLSGFFSVQLVLKAVSETNIIFCILAFAGMFLTAAAILKAWRSLFTGKREMPAENGEKNKTSIGMTIPVYVLAVLCVLSGIYLVLTKNRLISQALGGDLSAGRSYSAVLIVISLAILVLAAADHMYGFKKSGRALNSADHIRRAPVMKSIYRSAEKGHLDPYNWFVAVIGVFSDICTKIEHGVSWIYDKGVPGLVTGAGLVLHRFDNGRLSRYLYLAVGGLAFIAVIFLIAV